MQIQRKLAQNQTFGEKKSMQADFFRKEFPFFSRNNRRYKKQQINNNLPDNNRVNIIDGSELILFLFLSIGLFFCSVSNPFFCTQTKNSYTKTNDMHIAPIHTFNTHTPRCEYGILSTPNVYNRNRVLYIIRFLALHIYEYIVYDYMESWNIKQIINTNRESELVYYIGVVALCKWFFKLIETEQPSKQIITMA